MNREYALLFPAGCPDPYKWLVDEPTFDPSKQLALALPDAPFKLGELGYKKVI